MKTTFRNLFVAVLLMSTSIVSAQQVNTLYFLENAPMRHIINPAFQPVSKVYVTLPAIGYTSFWAGNNAFTMQDFIYKDAITGNTITPLHPNANPNWLDKKPNTVLFDADAYLNLLGFGFRIKDFGYVHVNISEHIIGGIGLGKSLFGLNDLSSGIVGPLSVGVNATAYTDIALGYSHKINDQWTVGGKFKFLVGQAYVGANIDDLQVATGYDQLQATGEGNIIAAAPLMWEQLPENIENLPEMDFNSLVSKNITDLIKPAGLGAAFDLGMTYKPIEQLQITASVTDLGFIRWTNLAQGAFSVDTTFNGLDLEYNDYVYDGSFQVDSLTSDLTNELMGYTDALQIKDLKKGHPLARMLTANLNIGIDANFWDNRVGVGLYSRTRFYNNAVTEELTFGAAFRPVNWFNLAASYSFINGHWSNIGAALSLAPYDGLMLTLATDYIPTTYATAAAEDSKLSLPYKTPGVNLSFGIAIVVGTNPKKNKDADKDGIFDLFDACPNTPTNVRVDEVGCPIDSDGDGIPDYFDECPFTPSAAYGLIDTVGCPLDTDGDEVPDYIDLCANTPAAALGYVDEYGCPIDTDGDGVFDYMDQCPGTPVEAYGYIDSVGCPLDTDGDGVYDYIDQCPGTPTAAYGMVDSLGCPIDTDLDGVPDYLDECPDTPEEGRHAVDAKGCLLDTDNDGVYDYIDECPLVVGVKENKGCPEVKREVRNLLKKAMSGIQFENGKATIKKNSYKILNDIAKIFIDNANYLVEVQGHTDNVGKYDYNVDLSERRAQAVRTYLINQGVPAERLTAHGYGPDKPIADNKTKAGRAKNRRVEFNITFEEVKIEIIYDRVQQDTTAAPTAADSIQAPVANVQGDSIKIQQTTVAQ
ncbi:MAG: OmpA family protein [Paludibacteraceae bacterium]|nr:OmpA family protein [Paludibacteraceae bacterium]